MACEYHERIATRTPFRLVRLAKACGMFRFGTVCLVDATKRALTGAKFVDNDGLFGGRLWHSRCTTVRAEVHGAMARRFAEHSGAWHAEGTITNFRASLDSAGRANRVPPTVVPQ